MVALARHGTRGKPEQCDVVAACGHRVELHRLVERNASSSASWLDVPSKLTTCLRNLLAWRKPQAHRQLRLSVKASAISALSTIMPSSPARSMGIVLTTTAPALVAASQPRRAQVIAGTDQDTVARLTP